MASDQRERGHLFRKMRSPRRFAPRDDTEIKTSTTEINAFTLDKEINRNKHIKYFEKLTSLKR